MHFCTGFCGIVFLEFREAVLVVGFEVVWQGFLLEALAVPVFGAEVRLGVGIQMVKEAVRKTVT